MLEADFIPIVCALLLGGSAEVSHGYSVGYDLHRVRVDCETADQVIEIGLDRRSSLDSLQQALFFASVTGKSPAIVLIDTDGREGPFELQIRTAAQAAGVPYSVYSGSFLVRWQMTAWLRERRVAAPDS